ncbi:MATE family efflux transporter [Clostridium sp.]|jgi:putative MATE family efflux protein|uniref:MATE family efflux transporter n=1 Tax=Clostridium sp. TaxID=1506 RepID=UPI003EECBA80
MGKNKKLLTSGPVVKTLTTLTIPMIFGMLSMVIFNIVDTYFIGKLGTNQIAALTFTFPVILIIGSLSQGIGVGASAVISKAVGEGNHHKIQRYTTDSLLLGVSLVIIFAAIGLLTIEPLFKMLGADSDIMPYIVQYMRIWYIGVAFVVIPMIGNNAIRAIGDMKTPSIVMAVSAGINVLLDPLFIFGFAFIKPMGVSGAAIATVISRAITLIVALRILIVRENLISFKKTTLTDIYNSWMEILFIGLPHAVTKMIVPVATGVITGLIALYGKEAIAAFGIGTRLEMFALMVNAALASVLIPFAGQNLGAGEVGRAQKSITVSEIFVIVYGVAMAMILMLFGKFFAGIFSSSSSVISLVQQYLWIVPLSYSAQGILMISSASLIVMNKPIISASLTLIRLFAIYVPLAFLGSHYFGLIGVWVAITISFIIIAIAAHMIMKVKLKLLQS